ncbi:MAG: hypothetical protein M0R77_10205 [Gammaproteobacteria bacterium]|nr:hypothetical protein [Gammaproteobacteria bacterium]
MSIIDLAVWSALLLLLFSALVGLGLILIPQAMARIAAMHYGWAPLSRLLSSLDQVYRIERFFYRHHRLFGAFLLAGSGYTLYHASFRPDLLVHAYEAWGPVGEAVAIMILGGNIVALVLGAVVLVRPSLLKEPERLSNRWIRVAPLSPLHGAGAEAIIARQPRLAGAFILGGALYAMAVIVRYMQFPH